MPPPSECPSCGEAVPEEARFCPSCGVRLESGSTAVAPLPPVEKGRAPVSVATAETRFFGVTPAIALLTVGVAAVVVGIVLVVGGSTLVGIVLIVAGVLAVGGYVGAARRAAGLAGAARARVTYVGTALSARSAAGRELGRLRRELDGLAADRRATLLALGEAVYGDDAEATGNLRRRVAEIDDAADEKEREMERVMRETEEQVSRARFETNRTMVVSVQEPYPPPDEADPPQPARVPEPYPPPGEGDPPEPARIPEPMPEPGPIVPEPEPSPGEEPPSEKS